MGTVAGSDQEWGNERTLVVLKPDTVARGLIGSVIQRFENAQLKIVGATMKWMDAESTRKHYFDLEERLGESVYNITASYMQLGPVIALVIEGVDAVAKVRALLGSTYPNEAAPGTIRGDYAHRSKAHSQATGKGVTNLVHASANPDEAKYEIGVWFAPEEIFDYQIATEAAGY